MKSSILRLAVLTTVMLTTGPASAIDGNANSQSDVWETVFGAAGLSPGGDADHDGWTNAQESLAGSNPFDPGSHPQLQITSGPTPVLWWQSFAGKRYTVYSSQDLVTWSPAQSAISGNGQTLTWPVGPPGGQAFFRLQVEDQDSDGDGLSDWEELTLGLDPTRPQTERYQQTDSERVASQLTLSSTLNVAVYEDFCAEGWPAPAILVVRRSGGLAPLSVHLAFTGAATPGSDYTSSISGSAIPFAAGQREAFVEIRPLADTLDEPTETVTLTIQSGSGYALGSTTSGTVSILNHNPGDGPSPKEAARFLLQAAFGPDQDSPDDPDQIPQNVQEVMAKGIGPWLDEQLARPVGALSPMMQWQKEQPDEAEIYNDRKMNAWWGRAMGLPKLRPDATTTQLPDPLRQRAGFALSQIYVISDRMERLATEPEAMAHFYDTLLKDSLAKRQQRLEKRRKSPKWPKKPGNEGFQGRRIPKVRGFE